VILTFLAIMAANCFGAQGIKFFFAYVCTTIYELISLLREQCGASLDIKSGQLDAETMDRVKAKLANRTGNTDSEEDLGNEDNGLDEGATE
jgi:hypothetical protein